MVKNPPATAGDIRDSGSILRLESSTGGRHGNTLQYSCLENSMEFHGAPLSLVGYSSYSRKESHVTEATDHTHRVLLCERHLACIMMDGSYILGVNLSQQQGYHT